MTTDDHWLRRFAEIGDADRRALASLETLLSRTRELERQRMVAPVDDIWRDVLVRVGVPSGDRGTAGETGR